MSVITLHTLGYVLRLPKDSLLRSLQNGLRIIRFYG